MHQRHERPRFIARMAALAGNAGDHRFAPGLVAANAAERDHRPRRPGEAAYYVFLHAGDQIGIHELGMVFAQAVAELPRPPAVSQRPKIGLYRP